MLRTVITFALGAAVGGNDKAQKLWHEQIKPQAKERLTSAQKFVQEKLKN
jgi:signal transduction histidine kinase